MNDSRLRLSEMDPDEEAFVRDFERPLEVLVDGMKGCPPLDMLIAADAGVLAADAQRPISTHLTQCVHCQGVLRDLRDAAIEPEHSGEADRVMVRLQPLVRQIAPVATAWNRGLVLAAAASLAIATLLGVRVMQVQGENQRLAARVAAADVPSEPSAAPAPAPSSGAAGPEVAELKRQLEVERKRADSADSALAAERRKADVPLLNVPLIDLEPIDALRNAAGRPATVALPASATAATVLLSASGDGRDAEYLVEIRDATGRVLWQTTGLRKSPLNTFGLVVPRALLPDGDLTIQLYTLKGSNRILAERYLLRIATR